MWRSTPSRHLTVQPLIPYWIWVFLLQLQGRGVDAPALAGWHWSVWKHMPEMCITVGTHRFRTNHEMTSVDLSFDVFVVYWFVEAWPSRTRVVFCI